MAVEHVRAGDLILEWDLYPRHERDEANLESLRHALDMGAELPPIVAWRKTKQVIDGAHRMKVIRERHGDDGYVAVEWRDYATKAEAFEDAVRSNATHGQRLTKLDRERVLSRAKELGIEDRRISTVLKVSATTLQKERTRAVGKPSPRRPAPPKQHSYVDAPPVREHPILKRHPIVVVAGQRIDGVENPEAEFAAAVRAVATSKADREALWSALLDASAAALKWAGRLNGDELLGGVAA